MGNSIAYVVQIDLTLIVWVKIRCHTKEGVAIKVSVEYVNLCGLATARCIQVIIP